MECLGLATTIVTITRSLVSLPATLRSRRVSRMRSRCFLQSSASLATVETRRREGSGTEKNWPSGPPNFHGTPNRTVSLWIVAIGQISGSTTQIGWNSPKFGDPYGKNRYANRECLHGRSFGGRHDHSGRRWRWSGVTGWSQITSVTVTLVDYTDARCESAKGFNCWWAGPTCSHQSQSKLQSSTTLHVHPQKGSSSGCVPAIIKIKFDIVQNICKYYQYALES